MKKLFSNATVMWTEKEINKRESLITIISDILKEKWGSMNRAVQFVRKDLEGYLVHEISIGLDRLLVSL